MTLPAILGHPNGWLLLLHYSVLTCIAHSLLRPYRSLTRAKKPDQARPSMYLELRALEVCTWHGCVKTSSTCQGYDGTARDFGTLVYLPTLQDALPQTSSSYREYPLCSLTLRRMVITNCTTTDKFPPSTLLHYPEETLLRRDQRP